MGKSYRIIDRKDNKKLTEYLVQNGQFLMPMVELIEASQLAIDELIDVLGRASIEAVLRLSAMSVAGEKHQGRKGGTIGWHGSQPGTVKLSERKVRGCKPRLRIKGQGAGGEVEIPAYEAINASGRMSERILEILMRNVSTRSYRHVIPEMAETVGVSKSGVSRQFIEQSAKELERLSERRFDDIELLIIYIDGVVFSEHHVICAVGVDMDGKKHVLGLVEGASENGASATSLLEDLVERGVDPCRKYLFIIDGSKALRSAIRKVFGSDSPVQRCRNHKVKNVCDKLPDELADQVKSAMKAAYKLRYKEGISRLKQQAAWLEVYHPGAAASLLEGLEETFTINRLELPASLRRSPASTNMIESPYSGVRMRTRRVSRWKNGSMVLRWVASAFLAAEQSFRRIQGYRDLWMLKATLESDSTLEAKEEAA